MQKSVTLLRISFIYAFELQTKQITRRIIIRRRTRQNQINLLLLCFVYSASKINQSFFFLLNFRILALFSARRTHVRGRIGEHQPTKNSPQKGNDFNKNDKEICKLLADFFYFMPLNYKQNIPLGVLYMPSGSVKEIVNILCG